MPEESYPSAPKREVDLGRGVVILPPERLVSTKKPEKSKEENKETKIEEKISKPMIKDGSSNLILLLIGLIAIISLILNIVTMMSIASLKSELKAIASDLRTFSKSTIEITTRFEQPHSVESSVPLNEVLPNFSIPIPAQEIETSGTIRLILPMYNIPATIPWEGKLTVFGSLSVNSSSIPQTEKLKINYTIPSSGTIKMKISASELFNDNLNSVIERLENLSK